MTVRDNNIKKKNNLMPVKHKDEINRLNKEIEILKDEIESQKEELETRRDLAEKQRDEISSQKNELTDSIKYARQIQSSLMPGSELFKKSFSDYFILNKPKDIVSGDFYWISVKGSKTVVAVSDCTGHGVPGAFMSMLGIGLLNEIVNEINIFQPNLILNNLRDMVIKSLTQSGENTETMDGMDIALITIDRGKHTLQYSGANNSLIMIRNNKLSEIRGDRMPVGFYRITDIPFTNHEIEIKANNSIYLFSDGYKDQFGWRNNRKLKHNKFIELLLSIQNVPMKAQKILLENNLKNWMGDLEQIDDILVVGLQI
jgi:serine phosphatase RsbU (regulator of sigma subunit)